MRNEDEKNKWYLKPVWVIILLFFVLGPLALPLLYKSPKFSKTVKMILTIVIIIYTAYLIFVLSKMIRELYTQMKGLLEG